MKITVVTVCYNAQKTLKKDSFCIETMNIS